MGWLPDDQSFYSGLQNSTNNQINMTSFEMKNSIFAQSMINNGLTPLRMS